MAPGVAGSAEQPVEKGLDALLDGQAAFAEGVERGANVLEFDDMFSGQIVT